jgi:hypothetical protein
LVPVAVENTAVYFLPVLLLFVSDTSFIFYFLWLC